MPAILHDKFYTPDPMARKCVGDLWRVLGMRPDALFIEPSAGAGAFCRHLPAERLIAIDIMPEGPDIATGDFLGFAAPDHPGRRVVIGNPPFGRNGALARAFLRHAMSFADIVAFILPASFAKSSMRRGIDRSFHLVHQSSFAGQSFETSDGSHAVNTVFQIWERRDALRQDDPTPVSQSDFAFVPDIREADLVIRRVGTRAGTVLRVPAITADGTLPTGYAPSSNYYIKAVGCDPGSLEQRLASLDLAGLAQDAVCPSLSKRDLIRAYVAAHGQLEAPLGRTVARRGSIRASDLGCVAPAQFTKAVRIMMGHASTASSSGRKCCMIDAGEWYGPPEVPTHETRNIGRRDHNSIRQMAGRWNTVPPEPPPPRKMVRHGFSRPPASRPHPMVTSASGSCRDIKRAA